MVIIVIQWLVITVPGWIRPGTREQLALMVNGAPLGAAAIALWWLFASRAPWRDRLMVLGFFVVSGVAMYPLYHPTFNFRYYGPIVRGLPLATTLWIVWLVATSPLRWPLRRLGILASILLAWCYCACLRVDGVDGAFVPDVSWRWSPTAEERFLAQLSAHKGSAVPTTTEPSGTQLQLQAGDWPGFRGVNRDSRLTGVRIATDWKRTPPRQLWKHGIGPGWSSFAVVGDRLYTQEQRGHEEDVVCYQAATGQEMWKHGDDTRFFETIGGAGPRATPTYHEGRLYTLGANGTLNCLDAATGNSIWARDILKDSGRGKPPEWGFSSSPLVARGIVMVFAGGPDGKSVLGYRAASGELAWSSGEGRESYSSPHPAHFGGLDQALMSTNMGLTSLDPTDGRIVWHHDWQLVQMAGVAQPALINDSEVLFGNAGQGSRLVKLTQDGSNWANKFLWEKTSIKPYYNDLVVYEEHIYGFDGMFFTCVRLADGKGLWRARGYEHGQALLLVDQGLLLIVTEKGEVALVEANPDQHKELARFKAIAGKTWNHPVVAHGKLFIRNGEEMACFELPVSDDTLASK